MEDSKNKDAENEVYVNISTRTVVRTIILIVVAYILFIAVRKSTHALVLIFTAFFLALALNAPVHWLSQIFPGKRRGSRTLGTLLSFLIVVIVLGGFIALVSPSIVRNTHSFIDNVPHLINEARAKNGALNRFVIRYNLQGQENSLVNQLTSRLHNFAGPAVSTVTGIAKSVVSVIIILVLTFMMLIEGPHWVNTVHNLVPRNQNLKLKDLTDDMYKVIRGYVNGQVILAAIAAVLIMPAVLILHLSNPLALMVIIFLCGLIPLIGHWIGASIITIVALFHSPWAAVVILVYYIVYINIENYIIQPKLQANTTNLSPLLVFIAVVIGVSFGGLLGALVAIPTMGCFRVLVVDYLQTRGVLKSIDPTKELKAETK
jgi:predicted PurR-regulated permease PerM